MAAPHELLDQELKALVRAGNYASEKAALEHALQVLLAADRDLRVRTAVELYRQGSVTLLRAAEIAELELETFKQELARNGVRIVIDESAEEIRAGEKLIRSLRHS